MHFSSIFAFFPWETGADGAEFKIPNESEKKAPFRKIGTLTSRHHFPRVHGELRRPLDLCPGPKAHGQGQMDRSFWMSSSDLLQARPIKSSARARVNLLYYTAGRVQCRWRERKLYSIYTFTLYKGRYLCMCIHPPAKIKSLLYYLWMIILW